MTQEPLRSIRTPSFGRSQIANDINDFLKVVEHLYGTLDRAVTGFMSVELNEIKGWRLYFQAADLLKKDNDTNAGIADKDEIFSGERLLVVLSAAPAGREQSRTAVRKNSQSETRHGGG